MDPTELRRNVVSWCCHLVDFCKRSRISFTEFGDDLLCSLRGAERCKVQAAIEDLRGFRHQIECEPVDHGCNYVALDVGDSGIRYSVHVFPELSAVSCRG